MKALRAGLVLLATTVTPAAADEGLHVIVHGAVDHDAVRTALSAELAVPVTEVLDTCPVPCLDIAIAIEGGTATLLYSPRNGPARLRTIQLGTDASQWPTTITLLAGNIVREESADILAQLPAEDLALPEPAPAPILIPPVPPRTPLRMRNVPPVEVEAEHSMLALGLVPGISSDRLNVGGVRHWLSIDALVGYSAGSSGLTISGVVDVERGRVAGFQVAGVVAAARRVAGSQIAGVAAVSGDVDGFQIAGVATRAARLDGVQLAGVAATADRADGLQVAGVATHSRGNATVQVAGVTAVAMGSAGTQIAGVASVARSANIQVSGVVNVTTELRGVQIAPINVARRVEGVQIGVINVGGSPDGFSFGLLNIVPGGRTDIEATVDSSRMGTVLFRHGGRRWHNVYGVAGENVDESGPADDVWMYGLGFGPSWTTASTTIDLEAICWQVNHGASHTSELSLLNQLRLSVARDFGPVQVVVGGAINAYVSTDQASPLITARRLPGDEMETGVTVETWPSAFVGLRL